MDPNANKYLLFNKLSSEDAKKKIESEKFKRTTLSFYKYFKLKDISDYRDHLYKEWDKLKILGRVYIATEGINAHDNGNKFGTHIQYSVSTNNFF